MGCKAITPELVSLAGRLEGQPFHLLAAYRQRQPKEEVVAYARSQGIRADAPNFTITGRGGHPQVQGNGYVPYYMVFDHTGNLAHHHMCGAYHGGDGLAMIEWVDKLLEATPAIWLGEKPFEEHADLAERVSSGKQTAKAVAELELALDQGGGAELERIHAGLVRFRDRGLARADALLATQPSEVLASLGALVDTLGADTALAAPVIAHRAKLSDGEGLKTAIGVARELAKLEKSLSKLKPCKTCKREGHKAHVSGCETCSDDNSRRLAGLRKKATELLGRSSELPIGSRVEGFLASLGTE